MLLKLIVVFDRSKVFSPDHVGYVIDTGVVAYLVDLTPFRSMTSALFGDIPVTDPATLNFISTGAVVVSNL